MNRFAATLLSSLAGLLLATPALAHEADKHAPATKPGTPAVENVKRPDSSALTPAQREAKARSYFTDTPLVAANGKKYRFYSDVLKDRIVLISFIYTSCTDACPMITHNLTVVKNTLGEEFGRDVRFVSLSIDPEHDTPAEMGKFATKLNAKHPEWLFLTGAKPDVDTVLKKLGAFTEDPKDHFTGIFIGNLRTDRWRKVRPDTPPAALAAELRLLIADSGAPAPKK